MSAAQPGRRGREGGREGGKVNKPIKDALSRVERRRGEGGSGQTVPGLVGRLPAALQRDRELSGVLRERRGARRKGGLKETERGGVEEQLSSVGYAGQPAERGERESRI